VRLTDRDLQVLKDMALSHILSRDQIIALGYFSSVTRANTRLRELANLGLVRRIETPFFTQSLFAVTKRACELLGQRLGAIVAGRGDSPRFLQHALLTTEVRIKLLARGAISWRFEQQIRTAFTLNDRAFEVRPDGLALFKDRPATAVEVDLGHVSGNKFRDKLIAYDEFVHSGELKRAWSMPSFRVLVITTGKLRATHLSRYLPSNASFDFHCTTFDELGVQRIGAWS
jgi:hypothetical protein